MNPRSNGSKIFRNKQKNKSIELIVSDFKIKWIYSVQYCSSVQLGGRSKQEWSQHGRWNWTKRKWMKCRKAALRLANGWAGYSDDHILYSLEENSSTDPITNRSQFLIDFQKIIPDIMSRMIKPYERNKKRFDANKQIGSFNIGDIVYRRNFKNSDASKGYAAKLGKLFIECVVTKKYSELVYDLQDVNTKKIGKYHIKDIKPGTKNYQ